VTNKKKKSEKKKKPPPEKELDEQELEGAAGGFAMGDGSVRMILGTGDGTFLPRVTGSDMNKDGKDDLITG